MVHPRTRLAHHARRLAIGAALALVAAPLAAEVKEGVDAWSAGDYSRAVAEWQGPANAGDPDALFNLAQAYRLGRGVEPDMSRARFLYAQAAEKGHLKAADNYGLLLFQEGEHAEAMPLIRSAADRGDPRAQYVLGLAHFNADYAEKDWVRAYALLTLARAQGLPQAAEALAQMDRYVPQAQKQQAQSLARALESEAAQRRAAELAAADLEQAEAAPRPAPARTPAQVSRPVLVAGSLPAPRRASAPAPARAIAAARPESRPVPAAAPTPRRPRGNWRVQLGAFGVESNADRLWAKLAPNPALSGTDKALVPAGRLTKLHAVGFASRAEASAACASLKREGQACLVTAPRS